MIVVDNVVQNWQNPKTDNEKFIAGVIKDLTSTTRFIEFQSVFGKDEAVRISPPSSQFDAVALRVNETNHTQEKWMLVNSPNVLSNGEKIFQPITFFHLLDITVDVSTNAEMAFFFTEIMNLGQFGFLRKDHEKEAQVENDFMAKQAEVIYIINKELSDDDIKLACYARGINKVEQKSINILKNELIKRLTFLNSGDNPEYTFEQFIKDAYNKTDSVTLLAFINAAEQKGIINFDKEKLKVKYTDVDSTLCNIPAQYVDRWKERTVSYLLHNPDERAAFNASTEGMIEEVAEVASAFENITNIAKIKKLAKEEFFCTNEELHGKSVSEIKEMLREKKQLQD